MRRNKEKGKHAGSEIMRNRRRIRKIRRVWKIYEQLNEEKIIEEKEDTVEGSMYKDQVERNRKKRMN